MYQRRRRLTSAPFVVPAGEVADLFFEEPYRLDPNGRFGVKAYALLRDARQDTGRIGVGTIVLRQREHVAAVEPSRAMPRSGR